MKTRFLPLALVSALALGCGGSNASSTARVNDAEKYRSTLQGGDAPTLAPQAFAIAEQELQLAKGAASSGDATGADLHADRAIAAYQHAVVLARLARATQDEAAANEALARASERTQAFAAQRRAMDREADDLDKKLRVAREAQLPPSSGPTDPERERARMVAAQSLAMQARLLCSAARLVSPDAPGLGDAETAVTSLEKELDTAKAKAPIDAAARARASCLTSLTKARRASSAGSADQADILLSELSQSGAAPKTANAAPADLAPSRDERGVVVTLRSIFQGDKLTRDGEAAVKDLGRVAAAHPSFGVQVVVHDAERPSPSEVAVDQKRGDAVARALVEGGAASSKVKVEQAGARAPLVDPKDARRRDRNARVEVVFVAPTS